MAPKIKARADHFTIERWEDDRWHVTGTDDRELSDALATLHKQRLLDPFHTYRIGAA